MQALFDHRDQLTDDVATFWFRPERAMRFSAGQFVELTLPQAANDPRGTMREFSISSAPHEPLLGLTVKLQRPLSMYKQVLRDLRPGDAVQMLEPMGDFVLPKNSSIPLICIAGGMGITPVVSIVTSLRQEHEQRNLTVHYAARTPHDLLFVDVLRGANLSLELRITQPDANWPGTTGRLTAADVLAHPQTNEALIYIAGPEAFVDELTRDLKQAGVTPEQLVVDRFSGYGSETV